MIVYGQWFRHPEGMVENRPASQRRDCSQGSLSPERPADPGVFLRPSFGTCPSAGLNRASKRRAIPNCPTRTRAALGFLAPLSRMVAIASILAFFPGCSFKQIAANTVGSALAGSSGVYASDDDPELIKAAAPFSLKLIEGLLEESPRNEPLLLAASKGFTQYAYAFVQQQADEMEDKDLASAIELKARARKLYLRSRNYGVRGLEVRHRGIEKALRENPKQAVLRADVTDVPLLYWTAASWVSAISLSKNDPELVADLPIVEAMIDRALELDERFDDGAIHSFLITYEMNRPNGIGDP